MNTVRSTAMVAAILGFPSCASAGEAGFYAGVDIGIVDASVGASDGFQVFVTGVPLQVLPESTRVRGSDAGWGAVIGYRLNRYVAAELGYAGFGTIDIEEAYDLSEFSPPFPNPDVVLRSASEVRGPTISALGILPFGSDRFEAFVRAGMLFADQSLKGDLGVASGVELNSSQDLWFVGAGLEWAASRHWSARLEYQAVDELRASTMTGPIRLERLSLGVAYHF